MTGALLERSEELAQIGAIVAGASERRGGLVVVPAPAGLGKTRLLEAASEAAAAQGCRVLAARASELETEFAFGLVRQLFEPPVLAASEEERAKLLGGAARHAAAVLDLAPDTDAGRDVHAALHGLYWLLANLSNEGPVLVSVDDLQWADEPSAVWLAYTARRLEQLPITLLVTVRTEPDGRPELPDHASRERLAAVEEILGGLRVVPGPLSASAVADLLEKTLGNRPDRRFAEACRQQTGGNAFLLSELLAELAADGVAPTAANVSRLGEVVPDRVGETIRRHLARVSTEAGELAASLAIAGDGAGLDVVAELAGMELGAARRAAAELVAAQILADAPEPRFRHPLLRAAVAADVPALERATRHSRAAELLVARGAPSGRVASHLLLSPPGGQGWVIACLRAAAAAARSQGATRQAVALLRRALAEPPAPGERGEVLGELGMAELAALEQTASEHLGEALALSEDPEQRAELARALATSLYHAGRNAEALDIAEAAAAEVKERPELREQWLGLEALLGLVGRYSLETQDRVGERLRSLAAGLKGETHGEELVLSAADNLRPVETADDLATATERAVRVWQSGPAGDPTDGIGMAAMFLLAGRTGAAAEVAEAIAARARADGSPVTHSVALAARSLVALDVGDLHAAEANLDEAHSVWRDGDFSTLERTSVAFGVEVMTGMGRLDDAAALLERHDLAGEVPEVMFYNPLLYRRGALRLAQRRYLEAEEDFRELGRRFGLWKITRPSPPWRSGIARALLATGRAEEVGALAEEELEAARRWGTPKPIALALQTRALTFAGDERIEILEEALKLLEGTVWKLDRARIRLELGGALRRAGRRRDAREALSVAMDEAHACGAEPLAVECADELRASGARPRRRAISGLDALTPSELRVAELAARGATNREIAQDLFVTTGTVETHLSRVYRKLDLAGRDGLAEALAG